LLYKKRHKKDTEKIISIITGLKAESAEINNKIGVLGEMKDDRTA